MREWTAIEVHVDDMLLDSRNPRLRVPLDSSQQALIKILLEEESVLDLAKKMCSDGMHGIELPILLEVKDKKGSYIVLEGNRRVAALKVLQHPDLVPADFVKQIANLKPKPTNFKLLVRITPSRAVAGPVLARLHAENVRKAWVPLRRARFYDNMLKGNSNLKTITSEYDETDASVRKHIRMLRLYETLSAFTYKDNVRKKFGDEKNIPISTLERLYSSSRTKELLYYSIKRSDGTINIDRGKEKFFEKISQHIVPDIVLKKASSRHLNLNTDIGNYVEKIIATISADGRTSKPKFKVRDTDLKSQQLQLLSKSDCPKIPRSQLPTTRVTLIPKDFEIHIPQARINQIYSELKKLNVAHCKNASAVLFRVFWEFSIDYFIKDKKLEGFDSAKQRPLTKKLATVHKYMKDKKLLTKNKLKPVSVACSTKDSLLSADTLNSYIHNQEHIPDPASLITTWDNAEAFVQRIWDGPKKV